MVAYGLFVNKDMFDQYGLALPETPGEVCSASGHVFRVRIGLLHGAEQIYYPLILIALGQQVAGVVRAAGGQRRMLDAFPSLP